MGDSKRSQRLLCGRIDRQTLDQPKNENQETFPTKRVALPDHPVRRLVMVSINSPIWRVVSLSGRGRSASPSTRNVTIEGQVHT